MSKPIVPLIMQENYKPDGWLGIILGAKIFVNFTKYSFEESMRRLGAEIRPLLTPKQVSYIFKEPLATELKPITTQPFRDPLPPPSLPPPSQPPTAPTTTATVEKEPVVVVDFKRKHVNEWNEKDVEQWLTEAKIHEQIVADLKACNGIVLRELHKMKLEAPEYFYSRLSHASTTVKLSDIAHFSYNLRLLFERPS